MGSFWAGGFWLGSFWAWGAFGTGELLFCVADVANSPNSSYYFLHKEFDEIQIKFVIFEITYLF